MVCPFSFCHCIVCPSSIDGLWSHLWYLQTLPEIEGPHAKRFDDSRYTRFQISLPKWMHLFTLSRLVIGTSRTVGSAKKFVRITSGFGGGEFPKTLRKVCTCQKLKFAFLLLEYCKIRECYAVANAFTIRNMYSLLLYMKCNSPMMKNIENLTCIFVKNSLEM